MQGGKEHTSPTVSRVLPDGRLVELLYNGDERLTQLATYEAAITQSHARIDLANGEVLSPMRADHGLIRHRVVLLPSAADEYSDIADLAVTVRSYIRRYVTLTETFTDIAVYYVLLTWVYDRFNELPYLRFKGDFGSGKTRALTVVGSITYKPIFASGASTVSPIFHTLDLFRGTLIFDEADFRFSDERAELTKIFNNGTVRGFPVLRTNMSDKREFDPRAFDVFGPKLVGMREIFQDYALESRFITEEMRGTVDENVPINLPESQKDEALVLRNKLLMYRFREHANIVVNPALADKGLSSRANQILVPLLSIIPDPDMHERIKSLVHAQSEELIRDRSTQLEALVLQVIIQLGEKDNEATYVPLAVVRQAVLLQHGSEFDRPLTARFLGSLIRNRLRLRSYRSSVYMVEVPKGEILAGLERRYGLSHAVPGK
ncbi:hypothetical protein [Roseateles toxinivorans]|nr:hypothetical protein [Roseateles toxinivorans]